MVRLVTAFVIVAFATLAAAETTDDAFQRGLAAYQNRDFTSARDAFAAAIAAEPPTARLLHNLALTYYQLNQKAYALAYWRKALAIDPNFTAARAGRELLEERLRMRPFEGEGAVNLARQTLERISPFVISWALALCLALTGWLWLRHAVARREARATDQDAPAPPLAAVAVALAMVLSAGLLGYKLWDGVDARATVVTDKTEARSLPNERAVSLFELPGGGEVLVKRSRDGWTQVQKNDGATGWIKDAEIVITTEI